MTGSNHDPSRLPDDLEKYAFLDSMEGLVIQGDGSKRSAFTLGNIKLLFPGVLVSIVVALAASFLSTHYGGPVMFFALLIGLAFDFLSQEEKTRSGIDFSSRTYCALASRCLAPASPSVKSSPLACPMCWL